MGKKPAKVCVNAEFVFAAGSPTAIDGHSDAFSSKLQGYEQKLDIRPVGRVSQPTDHPARSCLLH